MARKHKYKFGDYIGNVMFWAYDQKQNRNWRCKFVCGCGRIFTAFLNAVTSGHTKRCPDCREGK